MYVDVHLGAVRVNEFVIRKLEATWTKIKAGSNTLLCVYVTTLAWIEYRLLAGCIG